MAKGKPPWTLLTSRAAIYENEFDGYIIPLARRCCQRRQSESAIKPPGRLYHGITKQDTKALPKQNPKQNGSKIKAKKKTARVLLTPGRSNKILCDISLVLFQYLKTDCRFRFLVVLINFNLVSVSSGDCRHSAIPFLWYNHKAKKVAKNRTTNERKMAGKFPAGGGPGPCDQPKRFLLPPPVLLTPRAAKHKYHSFQLRHQCAHYYTTSGPLCQIRKEFSTWQEGRTQKGPARSGRRPSPATAKSIPIGRLVSPAAGIPVPGSKYNAALPARRRRKCGRRCRRQPWRSTRVPIPPRSA